MTTPLQLTEGAKWRISPERLMAGLGIQAWDVLLVGDGAGTGAWTMGIGHACAVYDRQTQEESLVWGGWSGGSVIMAELMAFVQGLWTFDKLYGAARRGSRPTAQHVIILTDNQAICDQFVQARARRATHPETMPIWAAFNALTSRGYSCEFRWIPRLSTAVHTVVDDISRRARILVQDPVVGGNNLNIKPSIELKSGTQTASEE